jgi:hypothetical protein
MVDRMHKIAKCSSHRRLWRVCALILAIVAVFAFPGGMSVGIRIMILGAMSFIGGASLGRIGIIAAPLVVLVLGVHAELAARDPLGLRSFMLGWIAIALVLCGLSALGCAFRIVVGRALASD